MSADKKASNAAECEQIFLGWIAKKNRKPMLVYGPLQSGKKTLLRIVLDRLDYDIVEPSSGDNLADYRDGGLRGPQAFIMRIDQVGTKKLPHVHCAPIVYVCHAPYDQVGSKAEIEKRFHKPMLEIKTGRDPSKRFENRFGDSLGKRDESLDYWKTTEQLTSSKNLDVESSLRACELVSGYFTEIVHTSYWSKPKSPKQLSRTADMLACADELRYSVPVDYLRLLEVIGPLRECSMGPRDLVLQKPKSEGKKLEEHPLLDQLVVRKPPKKTKKTTEPPPPALKPVVQKRKRSFQKKEAAAVTATKTAAPPVEEEEDFS